MRSWRHHSFNRRAFLGVGLISDGIIVVALPPPSFVPIVFLAGRGVMQDRRFIRLTGVPFYFPISRFYRGGARL